MNNIASAIYIVLAIITIITFVLTRYIDIEIIKTNTLRINVHFTFLQLSFTKEADKKVDIEKNNSIESEIQPEILDIISLFSTIFSHLKKCRITIRRVSISKKRSFSSFYSYYIFSAIFSSVFAYVDSNVEKLNILDNAFILSPDGHLELDIAFRTTLFNIITLAIQFLISALKLKKKENVNVRN